MRWLKNLKVHKGSNDNSFEKSQKDFSIEFMRLASSKVQR